MKIYYKLFILCFIFFFKLSAFSQFEKIIPHPMNYTFGGLVLEASNNDYIITCDDWLAGGECKGCYTLFKISQSGELIDSVFVNHNLRGDIININNNEILIAGLALDTIPSYIKKSPFFIKMDENFNIISKDTLPLPSNFPVVPDGGGFNCERIMPTKNGGFLAQMFFVPGFYAFYELNADLDTIQTENFTDNNSFYDSPLMLNNNNDSSYYAFSGFNIFKIDKSNLEATFIKSLYNVDDNSFFENISTVKYLNDNRILIYFGATVLIDKNSVKGTDKQVGVYLVDTLFNLQSSVYIGYSSDTLDMPVSKGDGIDFTDQNNIFVVSVINHPVYSGFAKEEISSIMVSVLDSNLNIKNQTFYGGDDRYLPNDIKATSDGGCIIISGKYEVNSGNNYSYIHLLKVNENGELSPPISNEEINNSTMKLAFIYPNPSKDFINVRYGAHLKNVSIEIFDISGKKIFVKNLENPISKIDIQNFKIGSYVYHILNNNKIIEKGKIIKE